jgi:hypothetical protein
MNVIKRNCPLIIPLLLFLFFTFLLTRDVINQYIYTGLITLTTIIGIVIYFRDNVASIDLKQMKVILREAKEVEKEIKKTAEDLIEITAIHSTYTSGSTNQRKKFNDRVEAFLDEIGTDKEKKKRILDDARFMERFMNPNNSSTEQKRMQKEIEGRKIME